MSSEFTPSKTPFSTTGRSRKGEPLVWLTAAGLALGVVMALGLLGLIVVKGLESFWPRRVQVMQVVNGDTTETVAGYVVQENMRTEADGTEHKQVQIFRGNKDLYGEAFRFIDESNVVENKQPKNIWLVERMEYGPAIVEPVSLATPKGVQVASEPGFAENVESTIAHADDLRDQLETIERKEIGAISRELEALGRKEKSGGIAANDAAKRRAELDAQYEKLRAKANTLREQLAASAFTGKTADGREVVVKSGDLLGTFAPNEASWFSRLGEMAHRIWKFLKDDPREANTEGGVFPAIFGTVVMTLVMSLFVTPFGVIAAIYLREYAKQGLFVRIVRVCVNNLAGVPSIVFGVFGLAFFVYTLGGSIDQLLYADRLPTPTFGTPGILWASLTLALLTLPVVIVATEEALSAVPRGVREAALACGASKWQAIQRVVLPASLPGILTGIILAMARGAGEVAPLMLVGVVKLAPSLPIDGIAPFIHAERKFMHLGFHIYDLGFQSPDAEAAKPIVYATALLLIFVVVALNLTAIIIRNRLKKRFAVSSF